MTRNVDKSSFVLLQILILEDQDTSSAQNKDECSDSDTSVIETWNFIKRYWKLVPPKLIISILYDVDEDDFDYQWELERMLGWLLTTEGKH